MWARVDGGVVREIVKDDPTGKYHPSIVWVACPSDVKSGWTYDDGQFAPPPGLTLDESRAAAYARAKAKHAGALQAVKDRYPQTEIDGWSELVGDAKEGSGVCIEAYAASMGIPVADACQRILTVREGYRAAYGDATGELTKTRDMIDQAQTVEDLEAINWPETKP